MARRSPAGFAGFALFKTLSTRSEAGRLAWDRMRLGFPALGSVMRYSFYAQFARTMGTLAAKRRHAAADDGTPRDMSGNAYLRDVHEPLARGAGGRLEPLRPALSREQVFPELYLDMMAVGEQLGAVCRNDANGGRRVRAGTGRGGSRSPPRSSRRSSW